MKRILTVILAAVMLTACQQVPQNVKDRNEELESMREADSSQVDVHESGSDESAADSDTGSLDYIRAHLKEDASKKYGSLTIKRASAGEAKSMPTYKVQVCGNEKCDVKQLGKVFFGEDYEKKGKCDQEVFKADTVPDEPTLSSDKHVDLLPEQDKFFFKCDNLYDLHSLMIDQAQKGSEPPDTFRALSFMGNGFVRGRQTDWKAQSTFYDTYLTKKNRSADYQNSVAAYYPMFDELPDDSYKMTDGKNWSVKDAVKFAESFADKAFSLNDPVKYKYSVYRLDVYKWDDDAYSCGFWLTFSDEQGCRFDTDSERGQDVEQQHVYNGERFFIMPKMIMECIAVNEVFDIHRSVSYKPTEKAADNEKLLTLGAAAKKLQKELAKHINIDFDSAELCYCITCDKYPSKDYGHLVQFSEDMCYKTCELTMRPYWCFKAGNNGNICWNRGAYYYVDAVTGEVHITMSINGA